MPAHKNQLLPFVYLSIAGLLAVLFFFLLVRLVHGAYPSAKSRSARPSNQAVQSNDRPHDSMSNEPIIFFRENSNVLMMYPNGDIIHRGRKVTTDQEVVRAMQEILSLSPCRTGS